MTDEEIDAMEAGRKMDLLVAEQVLGCTTYNEGIGIRCDCGGANTTGPRPHGEGFVYYIKHYSTDIAAAWQVVEKMRQLGLAHQFGEAFEKTTPWRWYLIKTGYFCLDICRAALKCHKFTTGDTVEAKEQTS